MLNWIQFFFRVSFLKAAPQDAPTSRSVMYITVVLYFVIGLIITLHSQPWVQSVVTASIQTALVVFVTNLLVWIRSTPERFTQTITALMGTGALIGLFAVPVLNLMGTAGSEENFASVLWVGLVIWETVVVGHILRHTMEASFIAGLGAALVYMYLSFAITVRILKVMSYSLT